MRLSFRPARFLLRKLGLEVSYAKYSPRFSDRKVYDTLLRGSPVRTIFDVGANIGQTARLFSAEFPQAQIFCFEPFHKNFEILQRRLLPLANTKAFQVALGDSHGTRDVLVDNLAGSPYNSLTRKRQSILEKSRAVVERVVEMRGDDFCKAHKIQVVDILKTDTEGFDLEVLAGFRGMLTSKQVRSIVIEVGFLGDQAHTSLVSASGFLNNFGFDLAGFYESIYTDVGTVEYTNALFVLGQNQA